MNLPTEYEEFVCHIKSNHDRLFELVAHESQYDKHDFSFLWADMLHFLELFPKSVQDLATIQRDMTIATEKVCKGASLQWLPWGKVLFCPASNAVIPVVPSTVLSLLICGNSVVIAPSRRTLASVKHIIAIFKQCFQNWEKSISFSERGGRQAIAQFVEGRRVRLLWFQGDSTHRSMVAQKCMDNSVDFIYEGSGNCLTIIDYPDGTEKIAEAARTIVRAAMICRGQLCTTPRVVFIRHNCLKEFKEHLVTSASSILSHRKLVFCEHSADAIPANVLEEEHSDGRIYLITFETKQEILNCLLNYRFGIQLAFFTDETSDSIIHLFSKINVSRYLFNVSPVFQRSAVAWGGYGFSGPNPVSTLLNKSLRTVVVHE